MVSLPDYDATDPGGLQQRAEAELADPRWSPPARPTRRRRRARTRTRISTARRPAVRAGQHLQAADRVDGAGFRHGEHLDQFDASHPIHIGRFTITDFEGKHRVLVLPEVLAYSSNLGAAHIAMGVGAERQREFLARMGMFARLGIELPERRGRWRPRRTPGADHHDDRRLRPRHLGHAAARGACRRGHRHWRHPAAADHRWRSRTAWRVTARGCMSEKTSDTMRKLMRLVVTDGSGKGAEVAGYFPGGKTGTAEKSAARGGYKKDKRIAAFTSVFPMNQPRYAVYMMVDEPQPNAQSHGYSTAGWVAAPAAGAVIAGSRRCSAWCRRPTASRRSSRPSASRCSRAARPAPPRSRRPWPPRAARHAAPPPWPAAAPRRPAPPAAPLAARRPCAGRRRTAARALRRTELPRRLPPCRLSRPRRTRPALRLDELLGRAGLACAGRRVRRLEIAGITADSRAVRPGFLFAALPGAKAGRPRLHRRCGGARCRRGAGAGGHRLAARRAAAAAAGRARAAPPPGPDGRRRWRAASRRSWSPSPAPTARPARSSSCASSGRWTAAQRRLARHARPDGGRASSPARRLTTPDPVALLPTLARLARAGFHHAAMEASSHGIDQFRLDGVRLAAAGFTNLTRDHLDYHGTMAAYRAAKLRLFAELLPAGATGGGQADMDAATLAALARHRRAARPAAASRSARPGRRSGCWRSSRVPDGQALAHRGLRRAARRCACRCPAASRPTTR